MTPHELSQLLPGPIQRTLPPEGAEPATPLGAFLAAMSALHERPEQAIAGFDAACDPWRADDRFVPFLARWVNLDRLVPAYRRPSGDAPISTGMGRLRALVASAAELSRWRGTHRGLIRVLTVATGLDAFSIEEPDAVGQRAFHLVVHAPAAAEPHRALLAHIIDVERPAYNTWQLVFDAPAPDEAARSEAV